jgi:hypothetical protein
MNIRSLVLRSLILPGALIGGLALASARPAQASPIGTVGTRVAHNPLGKVRVGGGIGVTFPIGGHRHAGYWTTQTVPVTVQVQVPYQVAVQVPDRVIGTDVNGNPIWAYRTELRTHYRIEYQTQYVTQQVWVPVVHHRPRTHGWIGVRF